MLLENKEHQCQCLARQSGALNVSKVEKDTRYKINKNQQKKRIILQDSTIVVYTELKLLKIKSRKNEC